MISITTQATIAFINIFFEEELPLNVTIVIVSIIFAVFVVSFLLRRYYTKEIEYTREELRNLQRAIADMEAQEAHYLAELDDLRQSEAILIKRNKALEKEEYILVEKSFIGRKPNTRYSATKKGREAFKKHVEAIEKLLKQ